MKKINGWLYAFWIALIVILIMALAVGLIAWAGSGADGGDGEGGGSTVTYEHTQSFEAEDAALMNAVGVSGSTYLLGTETDSNDESVTQVNNFNAKGDKIVFQLLASDAIEEAKLELYARLGGTHSTAYDSENFISVNGEAVSHTGSVASSSYGDPVTATISLNAGINYIVIEMEETGSDFIGMNMGLMNVDRIDLSWDGEATIEAVNDYTGEVFDVDATGVATMEAEEASLFNSMDSSASSTTIVGTEQTPLTDGVITNVKNFNTEGDKIVFQVNAAAAVSDATIDVIACNGATFGGTFADNDEILTVNGGEPVSLTGTLTNSMFDWTSYGALTGTISLQKGINYIEITAASTAGAGYLNVDRIDLNGGTGTASSDATEVSTADELAEALNEGGEIALTTDIKIEDEALTVSENTELDLAGSTLSTAETLESPMNTIEVAEGATLTVTDSGSGGAIENTYAGEASTDNAAAIYSKGDLVIESGTIESSSIGIKAEGGTVTIDGGTIESQYFTIWEGGGTVEVTIADGATIKGEDKGVYVGGDAKFGYDDYQEDAVTTLNVTGGTISCDNDSAICTLGTASADSAIVNISGGVITGATELTYTDESKATVKTTYPAVYIPSGTLNITGGTITGITAVEIRGGTASITGGTLAVYDGMSKGTITNSSGATSYGYQLCVNPYGVTNRSELGDYSDSISVTVSANVISDVTDASHDTVYVSSNITLVTASDGSFRIAKMTKVSDANGLASAVAQGGKIALEVESGSEIDVSTSLTVSADTELDLMGNTLSTGTPSSSTNTVEVSSGATLTIVDSSSDGSGAITNTYNKTGTNTSVDNAAAVEVKEGGSLVVESGTIESSSVGIRAEAVTNSSESKATITIDGGTIESTYFTIWGSGNADITINDGTISGENKGIVIAGDDKFGYDGYQSGTTTLNVTGGEISCEKDSAICTLGNTSGDHKVITISGGTITGPDLVDDSTGDVTPMPAVYNASGNLTITGGTITGSTAVEHRGGELTISGGTLVCNATGTQNTPSYNKSGATSYGYALTIYPYDETNGASVAWNKTMVVSVTGGTITGDIYVADNVLNGTDASGQTVTASISISGEIVSGAIKIADGSSLTESDIVKQ